MPYQPPKELVRRWDARGRLTYGPVPRYRRLWRNRHLPLKVARIIWQDRVLWRKAGVALLAVILELVLLYRAFHAIF